MADAPLLGRFMWYELLTTDMKAAEAFYADVVGWTVTPFAGAAQPYDVLQRPDGAGIGGVMKIPAGMTWPPHWLMYVGVPNLEEAVEGIERLGGKAVSDVIAVPTVGRIRVMQDPQGGMFAILEPATQPSTAEEQPKPGDIAWRELHTDDAPAALKFYEDVFRWEPTEPFDLGPTGKYYMFGRQFPLGGMMTKNAEMRTVPTSWGLYFRVPDVDAGARRVTAAGGRILNGPMDVPGGDRIVNCMDPQGAAFSLHQSTV